MAQGYKVDLEIGGKEIRIEAERFEDFLYDLRIAYDGAPYKEL